MKPHKRYLGLIILLGLFCITGCNKKSLVDVKSGTISDKEIIKTDVTGSAVNIKTTLPSGIIVDAVQVIPGNVNFDEMPIIRSKHQVFNVDVFQDYFMKDKDIKDIEQGEDKESGGTYKNVSATDGSWLYAQKNGVSYSSKLFLKIDSIIQNNPLPEDKPVEKLDFNFSTRKEAYDKVKSILSDLGINIYEEYECYSLPVEWMKEEYEDYQKQLSAAYKEKLKETGDDIEIHWSEEMDCYYFVFRQKIESFPVTDKQRDYDNVYILAPIINVYYSQNGIENFRISYTYNGTVERKEPILSEKEALEKLNQHYNSIILDGTYLVSKIELEYVPIPDKGDSFLLTPSWRFYITHTFKDPDKLEPDKYNKITQQEEFLLNAVDGKQLLSGGSDI